MIELKNVSKSYNKKNKVIDDISLKINDSEIFGILGANGVGKTTLIKMITGILEMDDGKILIDDFDIEKEPVKAKKQFGLISDSPDIFLKFRGLEYLNFIADIYEISEDKRKERIIKFSTLFEMDKVLNQKIESYSHGMRQKIMIIGVLLHNPKNCILDEPMTGLDPKAMFELKKIMREQADRGNCIMFSTHILDVAEKICDRIGILNKGKIIFVGTISELKNELKENSSLEELFMEITKND